MKRAFKFVPFALAVMLATPASAELVPMAWRAANDGRLTLDTATELEWLDLPETVNRTFDEVVRELGPGRIFYGFRHATHAQMVLFFAHAGITVTRGEYVDTGEAANLQDFVALLGRTGFPSQGYPGPAVTGVYGQASGTDSHLYASAVLRSADNAIATVVGEAVGPAAIRDTSRNASVGNFLVRARAILRDDFETPYLP